MNSSALSSFERTYLSFFATGDLNVQRHGRKIRANLGTTHPSMMSLMIDLLGSYGRNTVYPTTNPCGYGWRITCDLPESFEFLTRKRLAAPIIQDNEPTDFIFGLSGFNDAEGHIGLAHSGDKAIARFTISNRVGEILHSFGEGLNQLGILSSLSELHTSHASQFQLEVSGKNAMKLLPHLRIRHPEKVEARRIVLEYHGQPWLIAQNVYRKFRQRVKAETAEFVSLADQAYQLRPIRKASRMAEYRRRVESANLMRGNSLRIEDVMRELRCSQRTVYRYLALARTCEIGEEPRQGT